MQHMVIIEKSDTETEHNIYFIRGPIWELLVIEEHPNKHVSVLLSSRDQGG